MSPSFEVVWNGVNDGRDGDLLRYDLRQVDKQVLTPAAAPMPVTPLRGPARVAEILAVHGPAGKRTIIALSGMSLEAVRSALYALRRRGQLTHHETQRVGRVGRPERVYSLVREKSRGVASAPRAAVGRAR